MKRWLCISVIVLIFMIAGCSDNKSSDPVIKDEDNQSTVEVDDGKELDEQYQHEEGAEQTTGIENKPLVFDMEDGNLVVYGLTLGDAPSDAKAIWGEPEILDEEPMGDADTYHYYSAVGMTVGYYDDMLTFIAVDSDEEDLQKITATFKGDHYRNPEGDADYFFSPENGQLLIYGTANSIDGDPELRLLMSDENFFYYVDEGIYEKVEEVPGR